MSGLLLLLLVCLLFFWCCPELSHHRHCLKLPCLLNFAIAILRLASKFRCFRRFRLPSPSLFKVQSDRDCLILRAHCLRPFLLAQLGRIDCLSPFFSEFGYIWRFLHKDCTSATLAFFLLSSSWTYSDKGGSLLHGRCLRLPCLLNLALLISPPPPPHSLVALCFVFLVDKGGSPLHRAVASPLL